MASCRIKMLALLDRFGLIRQVAGLNQQVSLCLVQYTMHLVV